ncbi:hypothetical protein ACIBG7_40360 [Nonomuraea sp. NPDC050328]|uniref:hypothetical protein n=1 Tax=Nonomuraea sp. NPDC050328 TaxID=3364361 RepID=UPI00379E704F
MTTLPEIRAELSAVVNRIDASFNDNADTWTADKHLTLQVVYVRLANLLATLPEEG